MSLNINNIGKQYGEDIWGVQDVSFELESGVHGLLGPNGSGKSTLLRILTTVMEPTTGTVQWNGTDIRDSPETVRSVLGYLPQDFNTYPNVTAVEFLEYMAALRGLDRETAQNRVDELLTLTSLEHSKNQKLKTFSGGMHQRVGIAQALLADPELLVVDEPTVGLDPEARSRMREILTNVGTDRIVIFSTHIIPDIESAADTVLILDDGKLITHDRRETLVSQMDGCVYQCLVSQSEADRLQNEYRICETIERGDQVQVRLLADESPTADATAVPARLEDAYFDIINDHDV